jgi:hypothetical protein
MKFHETTFTEYCAAIDRYNLHPELEPVLSAFSQNIREVPNIILYGAAGVGKYSQALHLLKRYSPSELRYEHRAELELEKQTLIYRMSDIHYEVDFELLGTSAKTVWNDIYGQVCEMLANNMRNLLNQSKVCFILCKGFHTINAELLEIFYSYLHPFHVPTGYQIRFILLTEHISFISQKILDSFQIVSVSRPSSARYSGLLPSTKASIKQPITNTKDVKSAITSMVPNNLAMVCNDIIKQMEGYIGTRPFDMLEFREKIYDIFVYNLDVAECVYYVYSHFIMNGRLNTEAVREINGEMHEALKQYNNRYRPIMHMEYIFYMMLTRFN